MSQKSSEFLLDFHINREEGYKKIPSLIQEVLSTLKDIKKIPVSSPFFESTAGALIKKSDELFDLWSLLNHYQKVLNDETLRQLHEKAQEQLSELDNLFSFDAELMTLYEELLKTPSLTEDEQLYLEYELKDFRLSGLDKPPHIQERLKEIRLHLSTLALSFQNNVLDATYHWISILEADELEGLNPAVLSYFHGIFKESEKQLLAKYGTLPKSQYAINLSQSCLQPIFSQGRSRDLRERVFRAAQAQCSRFDEVSVRFDNTPIAEKIIQLRREMAQLLGYQSYQELQLENRFASSPAEIETLYEKAIALLQPAATKEFEQILELAQKEDGLKNLLPWDVSYYTDLWRKHHMNMDPEAIRKFFPAKRVLSVMLEIFQEVFGLSIHSNSNITAWHPDVFAIEIHEKGSLIGIIYCDLFARNQKDQGAWMDDYRSSEKIGDTWMPAVAFLCCNFRPGSPALLLFEEVLTLYHEFGHCLHHILSRRPLGAVSGLGRVPWDIVELPSQLFEKWCYEPFWLRKMATDPITGKGLPEELVGNLVKEQTILSGLFYLRQVQLGYFDWHLHGSSEKQPVLFWHEVVQKISVTPRYADSQFPLSFAHIFSGGYSAGYYSYLWADLYVAQVFERFKNYSSMKEAGTAFKQHFIGLAAPFDLKEQLEQNFLKSPQRIEPFISSIGYGMLLGKK